MSKVAKTSTMLHGHTRVEFEDGSQVVLTRGSVIPAVGDEYPPLAMPLEEFRETYVKPALEARDASVEGAQGSETGDGEVQVGDAPLGQQEGAGSDQPQAGDSNIPVGSGTEQEEAQQDGHTPTS